MWESAEEDVVGASDRGWVEVTGKGGIVELGLKGVVVMLHSRVEGRLRVIGKEVGFPIEDVGFVLVGEDEVDETFDVVAVVGVEKFDFWVDIVGMDISKSKGLGVEWCMKGMMNEGMDSFVGKMWGKAFL